MNQRSNADILRWCVAVMDMDDSSLPFMASLLSHELKYSLTERQLRAGAKVIRRILDDYEHMQLDCQNPDIAPARDSAAEADGPLLTLVKGSLGNNQDNLKLSNAPTE